MFVKYHVHEWHVNLITCMNHKPMCHRTGKKPFFRKLNRRYVMNEGDVDELLLPVAVLVVHVALVAVVFYSG